MFANAFGDANGSGKEKMPPLLKVALAFLRFHRVARTPRKLYLSPLIPHYPNFDTDPHPSLHQSVHIYLSKAQIKVRDYRQSSNPPILHRKDSFVASSYPRYRTFKKLTDQEDGEGLLSSPSIGTLLQWQALLQRRGLTLQGHRLLKIHSSRANFRH